MTVRPFCSECAFWGGEAARTGMCRRRAPRPTERADEIANWPMTAAREGCGDGVAAAPGQPVLVACGECRFWHTSPSGGLDPQDRGAARREWWDAAGHCVRHAPQPSSDAGCRGFWRATNIHDSCAEGVKQLRPEPAAGR